MLSLHELHEIVKVHTLPLVFIAIGSMDCNPLIHLAYLISAALSLNLPVRHMLEFLKMMATTPEGIICCLEKLPVRVVDNESPHWLVAQEGKFSEQEFLDHTHSMIVLLHLNVHITDFIVPSC